MVASARGRFALQAAPRLAVFNDAGVGKNQAGVAALAMLQVAGIAACTVARSSARIGEARSTLDDGVISFVNAAATVLGMNAGVRLREALLAHNLPHRIDDRALLDECEQGVVHQRLVVPDARTLHVGAEVFDHGVVDANRNLRLAGFKR